MRITKTMNKKQKNKVTNTIKILSAICLLSGLIVLFLQYQILNEKVIQREQELANKEEEIKLCIADKPRSVDSYKEAYEFKKFNIYSPLFLNKEVATHIYSYKRGTIKYMTLRLSGGEKDKQDIRIDVWEYQDMPENKRVVFKEGTTIPVESLELYMKEKYISARSLDIYKGFFILPRGGIGSVIMEFSTGISPGGHPIFVRLVNFNIGKTLGPTDPISPALLEAMRELEKVADTIDVKKY